MSFRVNIPKNELIFVSDILKNNIDPKNLEKKYVYCINAKWILSFKDRNSVPLFSQSLQGIILGYSNSMFLVELSNGRKVRTDSIILAERVSELEQDERYNKKTYMNHYKDTFCRTEEEVVNDRQRIIEEQQKKRKLKKGIYHPLVAGKLEAEFETDPFEDD